MLRLLLGLMGVLFPTLLWADAWKDKANNVIEKVLSEGKISKDHFGVWVGYKNESAGHNESKLFIPASISKIPTALAFFNDKSMSDYFHTWIYKTGEIRDGVLKGDLYLKGGGDPSFVNESMWLMINELKRTGIQSIDGKLYVDETYFDSDYYSQGRQTKRVDRAYDAPVSALSFNWNSISIYIRPGAKIGDPARVFTDPDLPMVKIVNKAKTGGGKKDNLLVDREFKDQHMVIKVSGEVSHLTQEKAFYKSIGDAALWTGLNFKEFLNRAGIQYAGEVAKKEVPVEAEQLVEYDSWDMARILAALSKFSNNFVAEMLTKHLGKSARQPASPANIDDGLKKITDFLKSKGWNDSEYVFVNPSGFTRENKMRADKLGDLLAHSAQNFKTAPEFMSSLPISGTDGTLKDRLRQVMREKVRAKTGYMNGIVSLAGYMEPRKEKEPITFVFFYNGTYKNDYEVRALFDKLLWKLYQI